MPRSAWVRLHRHPAPQMERHRRDLETKANHRRHDSHQQQWIRLFASQIGGDLRQIR